MIIDNTKDIKKLSKIANLLRIEVLKMVSNANSGHIAGPLDMADIFSALYFNFLKVDPKNTKNAFRDRLFLSNGHICPILYAALGYKGFFDIKHFDNLRKIETILQGHPSIKYTPGVENSSGPLGQGLSIACGSAKALKMANNEKSHVICITSDGELNEGQSWEALMFANKEKLDNLTFIVDRNNIQIDGTSDDIMPFNNIVKQVESFGLKVYEIDGHNMGEILSTLKKCREYEDNCTVIIANTVPGKGVDFMENTHKWHGKPPSKEEKDIAVKQLLEQTKRIDIIK